MSMTMQAIHVPSSEVTIFMVLQLKLRILPFTRGAKLPFLSNLTINESGGLADSGQARPFNRMPGRGLGIVGQDW